MSNDFAYRPGSSPTSGGGSSGGGSPRSRPSGLPPGTDPRKWSARFPVYQIDFTAVASGKRIATTKRRVRWRFGFSNRDALEAGETGTSCRGEEHDVTIVWSVTSGKRLILSDGQEVHYSTNRGGVLEYSWTMRGNHVLKVIAHAAPAMSATPGFRQYDLFIDGQSFFNMPKVYELGLKGPIPSHARTPGVIDHAERTPPSRAPPSPGRYYDLSQGRYVGPEVPRNREEEEEDLQRAISASIEESRKHLSKTVTAKHKGSAAPAIAAAPAAAPVAAVPTPAPAPVADVDLKQDLLDFGMEPSPPAQPASPPVPAPAPPVATYDQFAAPPAPVPAPAPAPPAAAYDQFASPPAYGVPPAAPGPAPPTPAVQPGALVPVAPQPAGSYYAQEAGAAAAAPPAAAPFDYGAPAPAPAQAPVYDQFAAPLPQAAAADPFAPQAPTDDPFAPKPPAPPTFNDISSSIMGAYGASDAGSAAGSAPIALSPSGASQPESFAQPAVAEGAANGTAAVNVDGAAPQLAQLSIGTQLEEKDEEPKDDVGKAMKNLVNIDDISSPVENLSLNPFLDDREKEEKEKEKAQKQKKSRGIPPPASKWIGAQPSLAEMQQVKPVHAGEKKPVMANPYAYDPNAANAGALVVHASQNGGGPPPLHQPTGFGVGANLSGGGYGGHAGQTAHAAPTQQQPMQQQQQQMPPQYQQQMPPQYQQQPGYGAPPQYQQPPAPQQGYANYQY